MNIRKRKFVKWCLTEVVQLLVRGIAQAEPAPPGLFQLLSAVPSQGRHAPGQCFSSFVWQHNIYGRLFAQYTIFYFFGHIVVV